MSAFILVYVTAPSTREADHIGRAVVEEKLAACANILPGMRSIYRWRGKVEDGEEAVLILKTRAELFDKVAAQVKKLHSNTCPCIVAIPVAAGAPNYLEWILDSTATA